MKLYSRPLHLFNRFKEVDFLENCPHFLLLSSDSLPLLACNFRSSFGTKVVPPKRIMKMLPDLFDHPDQNVRACSKGLTIELCRWIGKDAVKNLLFDKMRDTMVRFCGLTTSFVQHAFS